jgi:DNA-binding transcriptional LysR family regulator
MFSMIQPLSWDDQRAFLAVLEEGSLSAAARRLHLAQPTVRARVEALERSLGTVLFTRSAQGLLPTDQARALGEHARAMAHASDAFLRAAAAPPGTRPGEVAGAVRLSVSEMVGVEVLPPMLARLRARHPGLVVELDLSNASANLAEQEADVAVRMHAPRQDTLVARRLGEVPLGLFAHRDYLAARGAPESIADLARHDVVGPDRGSPDWRVVEAILPPAARDRIVVRTGSHPAQLACARAGLGIAVVQRPLGLADPRLLPVLPDVDLASLPLWLVTHRSLRALPRVRATLDHLAQELARYAKG